ncbi:peptidase C14 caspase catalytic subunit p20 [Nostoc commune NIES-4072]|uniref:Peptidase C14 caspase catalytic subunit p20 n=1 Tax=Nostoc commune NIES-4072 TaxID=2005467 RepID=A0A2R5FGX8_NOSCO|nr:caspase family protein [Nostoc commune]BBD65587.1 peptidase C14 caspase catalytic subunit p20 [Nostoc commune HK-02]GBG17089.1 peptidase C14 caspase catalytic subunit p20 [Nostoc commune NIES-4072]
MERRTFLNRIGSILAVLGIAEAEWLSLGNRYYQALAQPSPRKLALLIGINQYPQIPSLSGCLTDVDLQRELLIHRFGFQRSDILTLTEEQASREFIEAAFLDHLGKQAKPDDVVVFHFSGYGSRVKLETSSDTMQNALVPVNVGEYAQNDKIVNYILEETLLLLLRSLPTDRVTAVLDTSYYAPSPVLGLKIRALQESVAKLAAEELDFLKQLKTQKLSSTPIVLAATSEPNPPAREGLFSGFNAGLFTYALTQYLWEFTPPTKIQVALSSYMENSLYKLGSKQQPGLLSSQENPDITSLVPDNIIGAEGVVSAIEEDGKTVYLWLAGLPPQVLLYYGVNSRFTLATTEQLVLRSRTGLTAKAQISKIEGANPLQVGQLVQEAVRVLPRNINLTIALDTRLERIERVDATSAFAGFSHVSTVIAGEKPADYVFAKLQEIPSRYGLFSLGGELIPNTAGEVGEAVKLTAQRLAPKLSTLFAAKLWRLTENQGSSRLPLKATLEIISGISPRVVMQRETIRTFKLETSIKKSLPTAIVPIGSRMQYRVENQSDRSVYLILLGLNNNHTGVAFYSWETPQEPNTGDTKPLLKQVVIAPGETLTLPQTNSASEWLISGPACFCEQQMIFSTAPFSETIAALSTVKYSTAEQQPIGSLLNPLDVAQALLQDLHNASPLKAEMNSTAADSYILDVNNWASLSFSFQVV